MTRTEAVNKLMQTGIDYDADHLWDALRYALHTAFIPHVEQKAYVCECKKCDLTLYTSYKRLNCEYCGSDDPAIFTCRELED